MVTITITQCGCSDMTRLGGGWETQWSGLTAMEIKNPCTQEDTNHNK